MFVYSQKSIWGAFQGVKLKTSQNLEHECEMKGSLEISKEIFGNFNCAWEEGRRPQTTDHRPQLW